MLLYKKCLINPRGGKASYLHLLEFNRDFSPIIEKKDYLIGNKKKDRYRLCSIFVIRINFFSTHATVYLAVNHYLIGPIGNL